MRIFYTALAAWELTPLLPLPIHTATGLMNPAPIAYCTWAQKRPGCIIGLVADAACFETLLWQRGQAVLTQTLTQRQSLLHAVSVGLEWWLMLEARSTVKVYTGIFQASRFLYSVAPNLLDESPGIAEKANHPMSLDCWVIVDFLDICAWTGADDHVGGVLILTAEVATFIDHRVAAEIFESPASVPALPAYTSCVFHLGGNSHIDS